jgi:hypothetical protein
VVEPQQRWSPPRLLRVRLLDDIEDEREQEQKSNSERMDRWPATTMTTTASPKLLASALKIQ